MKCPKCKISRLRRDYRKGWPSAWECPNFGCYYQDPVKHTARWRALQSEEDRKALFLARQSADEDFDGLLRHINNPNYLK
jgi:hypothetical protein